MVKQNVARTVLSNSKRIDLKSRAGMRAAYNVQALCSVELLSVSACHMCALAAALSLVEVLLPYVVREPCSNQSPSRAPRAATGARRCLI